MIYLSIYLHRYSPVPHYSVLLFFVWFISISNTAASSYFSFPSPLCHWHLYFYLYFYFSSIIIPSIYVCSSLLYHIWFYYYPFHTPLSTVWQSTSTSRSDDGVREGGKCRYSHRTTFKRQRWALLRAISKGQILCFDNHMEGLHEKFTWKGSHEKYHMKRTTWKGSHGKDHIKRMIWKGLIS